MRYWKRIPDKTTPLEFHSISKYETTKTNTKELPPGTFQTNPPSAKTNSHQNTTVADSLGLDELFTLLPQKIELLRVGIDTYRILGNS
jgi:hypothetical protein